MKYYWISESTNLKEIGCYPQREGFYKLIEPVMNAENPRHILAQNYYEKFHDNLVIETWFLKKRAKLTDIISWQISGCFIISERLKNIILEYNKTEFEFFPIIFERRNENYTYYLWNSISEKFRENYKFIDFDKSLIELISNGGEKMVITKGIFNDYKEFLKEYKENDYPNLQRIVEFKFLEQIEKQIFALSHFSKNFFRIFINEDVKKRLEKEKITGIRYLELDEIL
jgi:hypothetical protein